MRTKKRTILGYGRTNSGKTANLGKLAEHVMTTTGKKTRLYTGDLGGTATIQPHIDLGIVDVVELGGSDPFIFLNRAVRGYVRNMADGKWIPGDNTNVGLFAFESMRSFAEALMMNMAAKAAANVNIGGGANISFNTAGDGENLKISGSNMAHYGVAQTRMTEEIWTSFKLPADYIMWTSSVSKDEDTTAAGKILGPDVIGKALTAETPRWFDYTFRFDVLPARDGKPERHILYLGNHIDVGAGGAAGLGNIRLPLDAPPLKQNFIEPADIVKALQLIESGAASATEALAKRLKMGVGTA
jgi:hypothetical protein